MRITGKDIHEAYVHVQGSGQRWEDVSEGSKAMYGCMAEKLNPSWTNKIVVLCGSTRFMKTFQQANLIETLAGHIVLTVGCDTKSDEMLGLAPEQKAALDELHLRKIDLADEILVLNVDGYIGDSTRREIDYAQQHNKPIRWLVEHMVAIDDDEQNTIPGLAEEIQKSYPGMSDEEARMFAEHAYRHW
jgi:hypothetical protein